MMSIILANTEQMLSNNEQMLLVCSALVLASNPRGSASSLSKEEVQQKAFDFKLRLLEHYFQLHPPRLSNPWATLASISAAFAKLCNAMHDLKASFG